MAEKRLLKPPDFGILHRTGGASEELVLPEPDKFWRKTWKF